MIKYKWMLILAIRRRPLRCHSMLPSAPATWAFFEISHISHVFQWEADRKWEWKKKKKKFWMFVFRKNFVLFSLSLSCTSSHNHWIERVFYVNIHIFLLRSCIRIVAYICGTIRTLLHSIHRLFVPAAFRSLLVNVPVVSRLFFSRVRCRCCFFHVLSIYFRYTMQDNADTRIQRPSFGAIVLVVAAAAAVVVATQQEKKHFLLISAHFSIIAIFCCRYADNIEWKWSSRNFRRYNLQHGFHSIHVPRR